ncbi:MAG: hypothetical protein AB1545_16540 [Thermodesulfobacteriota bacterium]
MSGILEMWMLITLWILILAFNAAYTFLPEKVQSKKWVRICAIIASLIILLYGSYSPIHSYQNRIYAVVKPDGTISEAKNFPWQITKTTDNDGKIKYIINEKRGDSTDVTVFTKDYSRNYSVISVWGGTAIEFNCPANEVPEFTIKIRK